MKVKKSSGKSVVDERIDITGRSLGIVERKDGKLLMIGGGLTLFL